MKADKKLSLIYLRETGNRVLHTDIPQWNHYVEQIEYSGLIIPDEDYILWLEEKAQKLYHNNEIFKNH